jgi:hypothetical protein
MNNQNKTTISLSKETKKKLDETKLVACETYDSVISRLVEQFKNQKLPI